MNRLLFLIAALAVPLLVLLLAAPPERSSLGLMVRPFGWPSLVVIHAVAALPLAYLLAQWVVHLRPQVQAVPAVLGGVAVAFAAFRGVSALGEALDDAQADFLSRALVRSLLSVVLAFPWCLAACATEAKTKPDTMLAIAALLAAFVLPMIQADRLGDQTLREAIGHIDSGRVVRADALLQVAADVSPTRRPAGLKKDVKGVTVTDLRVRISKDIAQFTAWCKRPPATPNIEYAKVLIKLDRLPEAEDHLRLLTAQSTNVRLLLGECLFLQERWDDSAAEFQQVLDRAAFDFRAEIATKQNRPEVREAVLREALEKLPVLAGYWHLQLGKHFQKSGRPFEALTEFAEAERLDPKLRDELEPLRRHIREHTPGCLVR